MGLALAYRNTKHVLKHKIAVKREAAVTKEITKKLADDKKISKKEKDERILWKKNEVAEYEATTFSIFYNNSLFLSVVIFASFYILSGSTLKSQMVNVKKCATLFQLAGGCMKMKMNCPNFNVPKGPLRWFSIGPPGKRYTNGNRPRNWKF